MKELQRFHVLYVSRYIKYAFILCVLPMIRAILIFDIPSLVLALQQDAIILLLMSAIAYLLWRAAGYSADETSLYISSGLLFRAKTAIPFDSVAVLEISRPLTLRLLAGSKLTLYFKTNSAISPQSFYLTRRRCETLADKIMCVKADKAVFAPAGAKRLVFTMLSVNVVTSAFFIVTFLRKTNELVGGGRASDVLIRAQHTAAVLVPFLPAGLAFITGISFLLLTFGILLSFFHTAGFVVCRDSGILMSRGGLISKLERRIRCDTISACDVRITPFARILRRYPVYIYAGSYKAGDAPAFAFDPAEKATLSRILPELVWHSPTYKPPRARSLVQYIYLPLSVLLVFLAAFAAACFSLPHSAGMLVLPMALAALSMLVSIDGYGRESLVLRENRTLGVCYTRFFTRHDMCVLTQDITLELRAHPVSAGAGRCDAYLYLPCHKRARVRGLQAYYAKTLAMPC